jgi:hypothetical protein
VISKLTLASLLLVSLLLINLIGGQAALCQDDVVTTDIDLVQTGVTVFDKQGRLVDGLKKEDFELRADGRLVPISRRTRRLSS